MKQSNRRDVVPQAQVRQIVVPTRPTIHTMRIPRLLVLALLCAPALVRAQPTRLPLTSLERLRPVNTQIDTTTFKGQRGLRATQAPNGPDGLIHLEDVSFGSGTLELELAGAPAAGAGAGDGARGFVGLAFRVRPAPGAQGVGGVALWIGPGSVAHFRNLVVTPRK